MAIRRRRNPASVVEVHPLLELDCLTVQLWWEDDSRTFVTQIPNLDHLSAFGETEEEALDQTARLILLWLESMAAHHKRIPLSKSEIKQIRDVLADYE